MLAGLNALWSFLTLPACCNTRTGILGQQYLYEVSGMQGATDAERSVSSGLGRGGRLGRLPRGGPAMFVQGVEYDNEAFSRARGPSGLLLSSNEGGEQAE